jgi:hypothetical protein
MVQTERVERRAIGYRKYLCRLFNGLKAMNSPAAFVVPIGTGAPERMKRGPIAPGVNRTDRRDTNFRRLEKSVIAAGQRCRAAARGKERISAGTADGSRISGSQPSVLMKIACAGVMLLNVRAIGFNPAITGNGRRCG